MKSPCIGFEGIGLKRDQIALLAEDYSLSEDLIGL